MTLISEFAHCANPTNVVIRSAAKDLYFGVERK